MLNAAGVHHKGAVIIHGKGWAGGKRDGYRHRLQAAGRGEFQCELVVSGTWFELRFQINTSHYNVISKD